MIYMMCGIPGIGKSYWIEKHKSNNSIIVSRDKIRFEIINDNEEYFSKEKEVIRVFRKKIQESIKQDKDVYIDATHLTIKTRHKVISWIKQIDSSAKITAVYFNPDIEKAYKQNNKRHGRQKVSLDVILSHKLAYTEPTLDEGFYKIICGDE